MPEIRVNANADQAIKEFQRMQQEMRTLINLAKEYSSAMRTTPAQMNVSQASVGGGPPHAPSAMSQAHRRSIGAGGGGGQSYNLNTPSGVIQYYENVLAQASPMLNAMSGRRIGGGISNIAGVRYQPRQGPIVTKDTQTVPVSKRQIKDWFSGLANSLSRMDAETRTDYLNAAMRAGKSTAILPPSIREFAKEYGAQFGAPTPQTITTVNTSTPPQQTFGQRLGLHFANNMGRGGLGNALMGGLKGAIGGSLIDAATGGAAGGALGELGAGAIGLAGGPVGAIVAMIGTAIVKGIGSQLSQGMKSFTETIPAFSQLSHALFNAKNSAVGFQQSVQMAGARVAMTPIQSTQTAQTLAGVFGRSTNLANLVQQTGANAILNGLSPSAQTAMVATAGQLGITNGIGASMSPSQYNQMFLNMVQQSGMQGRQGPLGTGLLSVYSGLGSVNPIISSANSTAAIYTAMNATGIQGLQGAAGANILSTMNSTLGSGQGLAGIMGMAAIYRASGGKITNPWQMRSIEEQGLGAKIGNTTYGAQLAQMVRRMAPGNIFTQAGILSSIAGISENQALQMLKSGALSAQGISEKNAQGTRLTISEQNTSASARTQLIGSKIGYLRSLLNNAGARIAGGSNYVTASGVTGNIYSGSPVVQAQKQLIQNAIKNGVNPQDAATVQALTAIMESIATQESGGNPFSINDNTTHKSYSFKTRAQYLAMANKLTAQHHQLALGEYQLENFHKGVTPLSAINSTFAPEEALKILLGNNNPASMSEQQWQTALENYSGNMPGYAVSVLKRASQYANNPTIAEVALSQTSINALAQAIAQLLRLGPVH